MIELLGLTFLGFNIWLGLYILAFLGLGIWSLEYDSFAISAIFIVFMSLIGWYLFSIGPLYWLINNPIYTILGFLFYLCAGCLYVVFRHWPRFLDSNRENIVVAYNSWVLNNSKKSTAYEDFIESDKFTYSAWENKDYISNSILMWFWLFLWDILESPIRWLYIKVYDAVAISLNNITNKRVKKFIDKSE